MRTGLSGSHPQATFIYSGSRSVSVPSESLPRDWPTSQIRIPHLRSTTGRISLARGITYGQSAVPPALGAVTCIALIAFCIHGVVKSARATVLLSAQVAISPCTRRRTDRCMVGVAKVSYTDSLKMAIWRLLWHKARVQLRVLSMTGLIVSGILSSKLDRRL